MTLALTYDATDRFAHRCDIQKGVDEYVLPTAALSSLRLFHRRKSVLESYVQKAMFARLPEARLCWHDLVFYLIVRKNLEPNMLVDELRFRQDKDEQHFIRCCESRRKVERT